MSQSQHARSRCKARENPWEQISLSCFLPLIGWECGAILSKPISKRTDPWPSPFQHFLWQFVEKTLRNFSKHLPRRPGRVHYEYLLQVLACMIVCSGFLLLTWNSLLSVSFHCILSGKKKKTQLMWHWDISLLMQRVIFLSFSSRWATESKEEDIWNAPGRFIFVFLSFGYFQKCVQLDACDFNERQVCRFRAMYIFRCIPAGSNKRHEISPNILGFVSECRDIINYS